MTWEQRLLDLFEDLEQQAEGVALSARDAEVAELARAEYSEVDLESRWHASVGQVVEVSGAHGLAVRGRVARVGCDWCLLAMEGEPSVADQAERTAECVLALSAVVAARGLSPRARPPQLRPVTSRLGLGSALRGIAEERASVVLLRSDGARRRGVVGRVGRDFLELLGSEGADGADGATDLVPFSAVAAVLR